MANKRLLFVSRLGCLASIAGPLLAWVLYPRANWLFALALLGIAVIVVNERLRKDLSPGALADWTERLLTGTYGGYDVDDFEHLRFRDPQLRTLHQQTMKIGGVPAEWVQLDSARQDEIRQIIRRIRELPDINER